MSSELGWLCRSGILNLGQMVRSLPEMIRPRASDERHTVTTFELFFDLVYVFAATQVTGYMAHAHTAHGVLQGLLILALLWWTWSGYAWLGNHAHADEGILRAGMVVAMAAIFVVALTIPEAWHDAEGGLDGPVVLVCAYIVVRAVHLTVYTVAAAGDAGLRHQLAITWIPAGAGAVLLLVGAMRGGWQQTVFFAVALVVDWAGTYVTSMRGGGWRLPSPAHWTERHGLFMILAIGESVVAIGVGAAQLPVSASLLVGAVLGVGLAVCLWWLYFDIVSIAAERSLAEATGVARVRLAIDAYTYLHFPMVVGVIVTALGVEVALAHVHDGEGLGWFGAAAMFGGLVTYLAGHLAFKRRLHNALSIPRLATAGVLVVAVPVAAALTPVAALATVVGILVALVAVETSRYRAVRSELRQADG